MCCAGGSRGRRPLVLIGKDTRVSGDMLEDALSAGLLAMGCDVTRLGVIPTPGVAYLTRKHGATAGVVISASHNTFEYNGIKFFNEYGFKLDDAIEEEIEAVYRAGDDVNSHITGALLGREVEKGSDSLKEYAAFLASSLGEAARALSGMKVVVDCANGAAYRSARLMFDALGVDASFMGVRPDGSNINDGCGSTHPERMQKRVVREGAAIGLAFDGDADRLIAADETGALIDGDKILFICAKALKAEGRLADGLLTATVMSNVGLDEALGREGIELQRADVGDRYVLEMMQKTGSVLGGEQSGHIIFLGDHTTGDGAFAALRLLSAVAASGRAASELASEVTIYPQVLKNARVTNGNKYAYDKDEKIAAAIAAVEAELAGAGAGAGAGAAGRALIRPSGTEPLVRVMLEGRDMKQLEHLAERLVRVIEERLR